MTSRPLFQELRDIGMATLDVDFPMSSIPHKQMLEKYAPITYLRHMSSNTRKDLFSAVQLRGQSFVLHASKAMFWKEEQTLILTDLHLGKGQHFRKHGIGVPANVTDNNFERLAGLIDHFQPKEVLILGDLFHSKHNVIWDLLGAFCSKYQNVLFSLVPGNHDILKPEMYGQCGINLLDLVVERDGFVFSHYPLDDLPDSVYNLHGHIHPAVILEGKARQRMRLSAFHFGKNVGVLPAFGAFTGHAIIYPKKQDQVFGIVGYQSIIQIQ